MRFTLYFLLFGLLLSGCAAETNQTASDEPLPEDWAALEALGRGTTVNLMMWTGDPLINDYVRDYIVPQVQERYDIDLRIASGQGSTIVQTLLTELEASQSTSELDLLWINGETFYQLRQINALHGPWTERLPNAAYIDLENPFIGVDFQQPIDGYELPWGNVQMALIYDSAKVVQPPQTRAELLEWTTDYPGRFTFGTQFTGLTFLKALLIDIAGGPKALAGDFDEARYAEFSPQLWAYIDSLRPNLWKGGQTFPENVTQMHQMFASGELWFTMSNNDNEVDNKILQGIFPETARAYVPEFGTIQNSHYLGIPELSDNKAGAMVVANFMISPEAQLKKQDPVVWGDGTILNLTALPDSIRTAFEQLPNRRYAPPRSAIQEYALMELAPEYMIRLAEDFRTEIINR